jgi:hypothetical protein
MSVNDIGGKVRDLNDMFTFGFTCSLGGIIILAEL